MVTVNTLLGPVPVDQLGRVLMHEHVLICPIGWAMDSRNSMDREREIQSVSGRLAAVREFGVKTIVDPTTVDLGRDLGFMVEVSQRSGVNIIAATGFFKEDTGIPVYFRDREIDDLAGFIVWELTEGMSRTGIKAGAIKVATGPGRIGQYEEKAIRAAARAQKKTGAPILTHTHNGSLGREQVAIFEDEGADLSRVIIGHSCCNGDLRYHFDLLARGVNVGIDRVGMTHVMPDVIRWGIARTIIAAGFESQLMLSQDAIGAFYGAPLHFSQGTQGQVTRGYTDMLTDFLPKLRQAGVSENAIETCLAELPRRLFGG